MSRLTPLLAFLRAPAFFANYWRKSSVLRTAVISLSLFGSGPVWTTTDVQAEELTFLARGPVSFISNTPDASTLGGLLSHPVQIGDEVLFYYTFESTTIGQEQTGYPQHVTYRAIKYVRVEVAGNVVEYEPQNICNNQINIEDDFYWEGLYYDNYGADPGDCLIQMIQVIMHLSSVSPQAPVLALSSTALPLLPPNPSDFHSRSFRLIRGGTHQIDIDLRTLGFPDFEPPIVSGLLVEPNPAPVNMSAALMATLDDSSTGGSIVTSAGFSVDGGTFNSMTAADGSFNSTTEAVNATMALGDSPFNGAGIYEICVRGTDSAGYTSVPSLDPENACMLVAAYDPSGGFVTGGGWIHSPEGACQHADLCSDTIGKANFGFVSRYTKGAVIPTGNTEFQFSAGGLNFHSTGYDWLVVNKASMNAQFKGSGNINGVLGPAGEAFRFMLWASDSSGLNGDTFRIKIWYVDAGTDVVVYDNGFDQTIGGGNIMVHVK